MGPAFTLELKCANMHHKITATKITPLDKSLNTHAMLYIIIWQKSSNNTLIPFYFSFIPCCCLPHQDHSLCKTKVTSNTWQPHGFLSVTLIIHDVPPAAHSGENAEPNIYLFHLPSPTFSCTPPPHHSDHPGFCITGDLYLLRTLALKPVPPAIHFFSKAFT